VDQVLTLLFTVTVLELFLGGGGRLTEAGPVTLRMLLFSICLCVGWLAVFFPRKRIDGMPLALGLVLAYLLVHLTSVSVGLIGGFSLPDILKELQQSLYWLAAPFFAAVLASSRQIQRTAALTQLAGLILAGIYFSIIVGIATRTLSFLAIFSFLSDQGEVSSRGGALLFYKGFLYLSIALVFLVAIRGRYWFPASIFVASALVLTLTRGLIVATSFTLLMLLVVQRRKGALAVSLVLVAVAAFLVWVYLPSINDAIIYSREASNRQRLDDMDFMVHYATLKTVLLGEGYGSLIDERLNIENTFLWALWKLGVLGLAFWITPLVLCVRYFLAIPNGRANSVACAFLFGTILIYIQTMSNPYLNNPIGLSFVMLALFSLRTMAFQRTTGPGLGPITWRRSAAWPKAPDRANRAFGAGDGQSDVPA